MTIRLGLVGLGKIARDHHLPSIAATPGIELCAVASRNAAADGVPGFPDLEAMLAARPGLDAVALCQPPQVRYAAARAALLAGKHVFLEKPPGATVSEVQALAGLAAERGVTLFASWHSRFGSAVAAVRGRLAGRRVRAGTIVWKEDVRRWHPGQDWIWQAGGFGVFDPGINALSMVTAILPEPLRLVSAEIETPVGRAAPIAARLALATASGAPVTAEFDWRQEGGEIWSLVVEAEDGERVALDGGAADLAEEYRGLYARFVALVAAGRSEVDVAPLQLVADACLVGRNRVVAAFRD